MPLWKWSKTAASNANADPAINWAEGQAPSSINDSARSMMARIAEWRDDITGAIVTGGTSTAYTVSSNQVFDSLAHMDGAVVAFTPHIANGDTVTLSVDSLTAKPLRSAPSVELPSNSLLEGTPYVATYNNTDGVWYLHGMTSPYQIPLGAGFDYWASTAPNSCFAFPYGQAISRTTYATLFAKISTTYGSGDGSTTFNLPDKRGRVSAPLDTLGGATSAARLSNVISGGSTTLGNVGGEQTHTVAKAELPNFAPTFAGTQAAVSVNSVLNNVVFATVSSGNQGIQAGGSFSVSLLAPNTAGTGTAVSTGNFTPSGTVGSINGNVSQTAMNVTQPTIICNYIMRVI